ncbi:lysine-N-methylase [Clostridium saccharoperbutylacetonicum]|uniref:Flagellin lysine-N-methylase FliB n=1 Tax=Clostridium saccharoperbutylacetonicum N1-4(HMT) TaxID=931276 RepID=M1MVQ8_9CLOT|nr:flagellin lysine-N-methylase [Clostridium saccharoperbutylacetonicum]AGF58706.1 flagellin lysine-N-methylase FliB [Clostridium saccharoperbutylacetonicum N1-4(HMT)]NRT60515.1 lysine-N-methylase [Clostridium saccharoperbutylacetonicum]NSB23829.1 lysine-N-methylase [Clostridium saccharoperbutylacetonicum]NSB43205.1 lysine-N-methylase [Clostridium saccharoperbutylacetonicum]
MQKNVKMIYPSYIDKFQCIGGKCEDSCCIGWDIDIDKETFKKYHKVTDEAMKKMFQKNVHNNQYCTNKDLDYGRIKLGKTKRCPFLDDENYCLIQGKFGEDYLSSVCTQFPRVLNKIDDHYEISLDAACPEAARIILGSKEKIEFKESEKSLGKYIMSGVLDTRSSEFKDTPIRYFKEIRDFSIKIIQNRNLNFSCRLYVLGDFLNELEDIESNEIKEFIREYDIESEAKSYKRESMNYVLQVSFLKNVLDSLDILNENDSHKFKKYTKEIMEGYNIKDNEPVIENKDEYINAFEKYTEEYIESNSYIFESYIVNFIYNNLFPFSESDCMFDGYILLLFRYSLMRFYLVGKYIYNGKDSVEDMVEFIQVFAKAVEHDKNYRSDILEYIKENSYDNMEFAKMLL